MVNNRTDNLVVSPYSINLVLSMLFLGTIDVSNTSRQLRSIMHLKGASYVDIHNGFKNIVSNFDQNYYRTKMKIGKKAKEAGAKTGWEGTTSTHTLCGLHPSVWCNGIPAFKMDDGRKNFPPGVP